MGQPILGGMVDLLLSAVSPVYLCPMGGGGSTIETIAFQVVPTGGAFNRLHIRLRDAPGVGKSYTFTFMVNGVATGLTCTISGSDTTGSDTVNTASVVAGDTVDIKCTPSGSPTVTVPFWYTEFTPAVQDEQIIMFRCFYHNNIFSVMGARPDGGLSSVNQPLPADGTFSKMYVKCYSNVTAGTKTITFQINGVATGLTCSVPAGSSTGNDLVNSVAAVAGDLLSHLITTATGGAYPAVSMVFVPTLSGRYIHMGGNPNSIVNNATRYNVLSNAQTGAYNSTEANALIPLPYTFTIEKFYTCCQWSMATTISCQVNIRVNGAASGLTVTLVNVPVPYFEQKSDLSNAFTILAGSTGSLQTITGLGIQNGILNWSFTLKKPTGMKGLNPPLILGIY